MNAEVVWNNSSLKKKKHGEYEQKDVYLNSSVRMTYIHLFCFVCELCTKCTKLQACKHSPTETHCG